MDWIKVLTKHALFEYTDLKDSEFVAWIKIMALTANLEHDPTREQILKHVNYQTLASLSEKLHKHSTDLPSVLHKVLIDVAYVAHKRELGKANTKRFREKSTPVSDNVSVTSANREEKRREEKILKAGTPPEPPVDNSEKLPPPPDADDTPEEDQKRCPEEEPKEQKTPSRNTHGERWSKKQGQELEEFMKEIQTKIKPYPFQQVFKFTQTYYNRANPDAMLKVLQSFRSETMKGRIITNPFQYLEAALMGSTKTGKAGENGKAEAAESDREAAEYKKQDGFEGLGAILNRARAAP